MNLRIFLCFNKTDQSPIQQKVDWLYNPNYTESRDPVKWHFRIISAFAFIAVCLSTLTTPTFGILDDVRALVLAVLSTSVVSRLLHAAPAAARRAAGLWRIC